MKNKWVILILIQAIISLVAGILLSKMSIIGRIGVSTVYTEYAFMKHWYKGFAAVFVIQLLLIAILWIVKRTTTFKNFSIVNLVFIILGLIGLIYTFYDFTSTSHQYMNSQFHAGGYLFWAGWFVTCIFFFFARVKPKPAVTPINTSEVTNSDDLNL
ncbi:hypothetical protein [Paenimyroides aestuarii]|uniref:Uncharacterized protein n=1 Tax=Paenimyroides aestuarii TaxID=2968490 RepID=A0ABY5NQ26_9FLAO|nr:hypothetical protein [Paenimyroides aestuarii]UUV20547.1 hypothetical protein NPX36_09285 [Paenimyroides aestuarii]